jgi:hypothetical protein
LGFPNRFHNNRHQDCLAPSLKYYQTPLLPLLVVDLIYPFIVLVGSRRRRQCCVGHVHNSEVLFVTMLIVRRKYTSTTLLTLPLISLQGYVDLSLYLHRVEWIMDLVDLILFLFALHSIFYLFSMANPINIYP